MKIRHHWNKDNVCTVCEIIRDTRAFQIEGKWVYKAYYFDKFKRELPKRPECITAQIKIF